uniref:Uncharacterized protein n=1 Tax=Oryza brachyantha TaxID=4533 RepID=J3LE52_ORYBR
MGRDPAVELPEFPHYFAFSLEGRIRPRHEALRERRVQMSLKDMLTSSDDEFRERLVDAALSAARKIAAVLWVQEYQRLNSYLMKKITFRLDQWHQQ